MPKVSNKSKRLFLVLTKQWFDAIASGGKREEYREITPHWCKRLEGENYNRVTFQLGYSAKAPRVTLPLLGISRGYPNPDHPEWYPNEWSHKECFVLKLGNQEINIGTQIEEFNEVFISGLLDEIDKIDQGDEEPFDFNNHALMKEWTIEFFELEQLDNSGSPVVIKLFEMWLDGIPWELIKKIATSSKDRRYLDLCQVFKSVRNEILFHSYIEWFDATRKFKT